MISKYISIIIPAFDEGKNLKILLPQIIAAKKQMAEKAIAIDVLVVLPRVADPMSVTAVLTNQCRYINRTPSDSFGDAIRTGIMNTSANSEFTIFLDADGSHSPRSLEKLISYSDEADVVVASRYTRGGSTSHSFVLEAMSRLLNYAFRVVIGIPCSDISTNFKLYKSNDLKQLNLTCSNFDVIEEILIRLKYEIRPNLKILEVPDHFGERMTGRSKRKLLIFSLSYIVTLLRLKLLVRSSATDSIK